MNQAKQNNEEFKHISVMPDEVINYLQISPDKIYCDGTLGGAGHSRLILNHNCKALYSFDQDIEVIQRIKKIREETNYQNWNIIHSNFEDIPQFCAKHNISIDGGLLLDLGLSSIQLDDPERGFSFQVNTRLDMRLNPNAELSAYEVINEYDEKTLADIIYKYGEERLSRQIANLIIKTRPINTCKELADIVMGLYKKRFHGRSKTHPATKTFQAIRIYINREFEVLENLLSKLDQFMGSGSRIAIISFHSLEDRIVKLAFREGVKAGKFKFILKKPLEASREEITCNSRSRSAKLRVVELI